MIIKLKDILNIFDFSRRSWSWDLGILYPKHDFIWRLLSLVWLVSTFAFLFDFIFKMRDAILAGGAYYQSEYNMLTADNITTIIPSGLVGAVLAPSREDRIIGKLKNFLFFIVDKTGKFLQYVLYLFNFGFLPIKYRIIANIIKDMALLSIWIWADYTTFLYTIGGTVYFSVGSGLQNITRVIPTKSFPF